MPRAVEAFGIPSPYKRWARQGTNDWSRGSPSVYDLPLPPVHPFSFPLAQTKRTIQSSAPDRIELNRTEPNRPAHVVCLADPPKLPRHARPIHHLHPQTYPGRRAVVCDCAAQVADGDSIFVIAKAGFGFAVVDDHATQIIRFAVLVRWCR